MVIGQRASFCVATNYSHGVDVAHCVPSNEREWWDLNRMDRYARPSALLFSTQPQDSPANLVPLRSDFHRVLDERHLCFVPKEVEGSDSDEVVDDGGDPPAPVPSSEPPPPVQTHLLIHVVVPSPNGQVAGLWHNRALHALPPGLSKECLFARFAYTILSPSVFCSTFLSGATVARRLCIRNPETQIPGVKMEGPAGCRRILRTARSRSPRKRSAPPPGNGDGDGDGCGAEEVGGGEEEEEGEEEQGRDDASGGGHGGFGDSGYFERPAPFDSPSPGLLAQFGPDPTYTKGEEEEEEEEEEERGRGRKRTFEAEVEGGEVYPLRASKLRRPRF
jgi:ribosomal protein L12E/L44/L45/RPP1/RPP2